MAIRQRRSSWQVDYYDEKGKRQRKTCKTEAEAQAFQATVDDRKAVKVAATPTPTTAFAEPTLQSVLDLVKKRVWADTKGERTAVKNADDCVKLLKPDARIADITTEQIDLMVDAMKAEGLEPGTINRKLATMPLNPMQVVHEGAVDYSGGRG